MGAQVQVLGGHRRPAPQDRRRAGVDVVDRRGGIRDREPYRLGIQMSQRARAVEIWAVLASLGRDGVTDLVDRTSDFAQRFAGLLVEGGAELLAPVVLNQALVAFGDDATTDAVIAAMQPFTRKKMLHTQVTFKV